MDEEVDALEQVDETLAGELLSLETEVKGLKQGGADPNLEQRISVAHARVGYVAAESRQGPAFGSKTRADDS